MSVELNLFYRFAVALAVTITALLSLKLEMQRFVACLSIAELSSQPDGPRLTTAARAIVMAALANTFAKGGIIVATGSAALRRTILPGMLLILAAGIAVILVI